MAALNVWLERVVILIIVGIGLFILYRPLKEPIDMFFGMIKRVIGGGIDRVRDASGGGTISEITYG